MKTYQSETRNGFEKTLAWLRQWACARSYGLGSKLPWDPQFLVESLSDSTIYMAYYTIAHMLHGPPIDGSVVGPLGITAEQMTDEMWEYVFANGAYDSTAPIPLEKLNKLKAEFSYFYPMDIRSSGKDLIPNHLTFCIYVHAALFGEEHWPKSMRANGHLMLNGEKMSKSTGNSLTLKDSLVKFGADATRVTLADAGDSIEDANFEEATANAAILRLHTLIDWCDELVKNQGQLRRGDANLLWDKIFANEINEAIELAHDSFEKAMYKDALKVGFYQLLSARDLYQAATASEGGMHVDLALRFVRIQALLITPIAPHVAEHLWSTILSERTSVQTASFPTPDAPRDQAITDAATYVRSKVSEIRQAELGFAKKKAKGKGAGGFDPSKPKACKIWVAKRFPEWQEEAVEIVKGAWRESVKSVDDKKVKEDLAAKGLIKDKRYMPFIAQLKVRLSFSFAFSFIPSAVSLRRLFAFLHSSLLFPPFFNSPVSLPSHLPFSTDTPLFPSSRSALRPSTTPPQSTVPSSSRKPKPSPPRCPTSKRPSGWTTSRSCTSTTPSRRRRASPVTTNRLLRARFRENRRLCFTTRRLRLGEETSRDVVYFFLSPPQ
jgi:leucyl-tRNA synthetase